MEIDGDSITSHAAIYARSVAIVGEDAVSDEAIAIATGSRIENYLTEGMDQVVRLQEAEFGACRRWLHLGKSQSIETVRRDFPDIRSRHDSMHNEGASLENYIITHL